MLGFGPFPILFSTNLFLWFRDDWFYLQFLMIGVGFLGKEFVRWQRDGRSWALFGNRQICSISFGEGFFGKKMVRFVWMLLKCFGRMVKMWFYVLSVVSAGIVIVLLSASRSIRY